jgi:hypothetical protein
MLAYIMTLFSGFLPENGTSGLLRLCDSESYCTGVTSASIFVVFIFSKCLISPREFFIMYI